MSGVPFCIHSFDGAFQDPLDESSVRTGGNFMEAGQQEKIMRKNSGSLNGQSRARSTAQSFIWSAYSMLITTLFPFVLRTVMIHRMGLIYAGVSSLFTSILQIVNLADLGFESAVTFFLYKPIAKAEERVSERRAGAAEIFSCKEGSSTKEKYSAEGNYPEENAEASRADAIVKRQVISEDTGAASEWGESGTEEEIDAILSLIRRIYLIVGLLILGIGFAVMPFLPNLVYGKEYPVELNLYLIYAIYIINSAIPYLFGNYKAVLFKAGQRNDILNRIGGTSALCMYMMQLAVLIRSQNYYLYTILLLLNTSLAAFLIYTSSRRYFPKYTCKGWPPHTFVTKFRKQVYAIALSKVRTVTRNSFDSVVISAFLGLAVLAQYQNYYQVMQVAFYMITLLHQSVAPSLGNSIAVGTRESNYHVLTEYTFIQSGVMTVTMSCLLTSFQPFISLWVGEENLLPYAIVLIFCVYFYMLGMSDSCVMLRETTGIWWKGRYIAILEAVFNLALNILLVRPFGVGGVVVATIITIAGINLPSEIYYLFRYYFKQSPLRYILTVAAYTGETICILAATWWICSDIPAGTISGLLIRLLSAVLCSGGMFLLIHCRSPHLRETLKLIRTAFSRR